MFEPLIYDSRPLAPEDRLQTWYQWTILGLAIGSLLLPLLYYLFLFVRYKWRLYKATPVEVEIETSGKLSDRLRKVTRHPYCELISDEALSKVASYAFCAAQQLSKQEESLNTVDLVSLRLDADVSNFQFSANQLVFAHCDDQILDGIVSGSQRDQAVALMEHIHTRLSMPATPYRGIVLQLSSKFTAEIWMTLCCHLRSLNLLIILELIPSYDELIGINLKTVDGLIIRNATTLSTGLRRDFFRGFELRDVLGRCTKQRAKRSHFITILHDPCQTPSTPTVRRAFKFARFHEVLLCICSLDMSITPGCLPMNEPYSAFDWLKRLDVLEFHRNWNQAMISAPGNVSSQCDLFSLERILPGLLATFFSSPTSRDTSRDPGIEFPAPAWATELPLRASYFSSSETGNLLSTNACYELRCPILESHASSVLETQRHLRKLGMLQELTIYEKQEVLDRLAPFLAEASEHLTMSERTEIADLVAKVKEQGLRVFQGLDSGFTLPEDRFHLWSVAEELDGVEYIYTSLKVSDLTAVLIHQFLLLRGFTRRRCFEIELILDRFEGETQYIPRRLIAELRLSTYAELLSHLQNIRLSRDADCEILENVSAFVKFLLLDETTREAWKKTHGQRFLSEEMSPKEVYQYRLDWYSTQGFDRLPSILALNRMHSAVEHTVIAALRNCDTIKIDMITKVLCSAYKDPMIPVSMEADLFGLMVLCAFRKYGVEETYIESSDRCPIYHFQKDQPGVFSELWVIGSQCEVYFDVTPGILGGMHYARYRTYLEGCPPPADAWNGKDVFTAYHKVEDPTEEGMVPGDGELINPFEAKSPVFFPRVQKFAFLAVFCLPAVCDVMLLVFLGRGVFQTAFMGSDDVQYGTLGLLTALLLCSGTIAWIGSSGGYYLYNAAFDSMNHLMVQKLSGAILLTFAVGSLGFLGIGTQRGWYAGMIFFAYLLGIATYLNILGILATMHRDGAPFPSGRATLWKTLPILLISPVVTTFIHDYDVLIYLVVIYTFLFMLYRNYRNLCIEWSQWHTTVQLIDDEKVLNWYRSVAGLDDDFTEYEVARRALEKAVKSARGTQLHISFRSLFTLHLFKRAPKSDVDNDALVKQLAPGLEYSRWLLKKDAGPGASAPSPYSSAWNNSLKVSLNTYQLFVRGLKEHSAFLQFRYAKNDIAYNVVMFIAALLDRWVAITMSAAGDGPVNLYKTPRNRFAISFALSFFLTSAVALDYQLQFCWTAVIATSSKPLTSSKGLDHEESNEMGRKKKLYWTALRDLLVIMCFLFGIWTMLLVFWVQEVVQLETYFAYVAAYSFVIWFQFNRVFIKDGTKAFLITGSSICIGYFVGVVMHLLPATYNWHFIDVVALGTGTSIAGFASFHAAEFGSGRDEVDDNVHSPQELMNKTGWKTHSQKFIGLDYQDSYKLTKALQNACSKHDVLQAVRIDQKIHEPLCFAITEHLRSLKPSAQVSEAFPDWIEMLDEIVQSWEDERIQLNLMPEFVLMNLDFARVSAFSVHNEAKVLEIFVPVMIMAEDWLLSHKESLARIISQALLHEAFEHLYSMSHSDAACAELLTVKHPSTDIPERMEVQINAMDIQDAEAIIRRTNVEVIGHLCLGFAVNTQWRHLPEDLRRFIIHRVMGSAYSPNATSIPYMTESKSKTGKLSWSQLILRSDLRLRLALNIHHKCIEALDHGMLPAKRLKYASKTSDNGSYLIRENSTIERIYYGLYLFFQYIAVISVGDPDVPRELVYITRGTSCRKILRTSLLSIWRVCSTFRHFLIELTLLHSRPEVSEILNYCRHGVKRTLYRSRITVERPSESITGFEEAHEDGNLIMNIFSGLLLVAPKDNLKQIERLTYSPARQLIRREVLKDQTVLESYTYVYTPARKIPIGRQKNGVEIVYDEHGRIVHGQLLAPDETTWNFSYTYTNDNSRTEILSAVYISESEYIAVYWSVPRTTSVIDEEIPSAWASALKITKTIHIKDGIQWSVQYTYRHKRDPVRKCVRMEGQDVQYLDHVPEWILKDPNKFYAKPVSLHFDTEDVLFHHSSPEPIIRRWGRKLLWPMPRTVYTEIDAGTLRTMLWSRWHKSKSLDGVVCCYVDEMILRNEATLGPYWKARESGRFHDAVGHLDRHLEFILARIEIEDSVSQNTFLPYKPMDLYTMGTGGSANIKTRQLDDNYCDTEDRLSVAFLDTGCFPDQPGGVSNCRRDLVNGHTTIRNHVFTESANDFGVPRYQVDRNIQSVKVLPMWGLDYLSPYHGLFENLLDSQVRYREHHTTEEDIRNQFLPILRTLVRGARSQMFTQKDLTEYTQAFVDLSIYFEEKDFLKTWNSNQVKRTWRECWLNDMPNSISTSTYFTLELPTMGQLDEAMELWRRYFFVFSVRIPEDVPKVFQCTHHGVGSIFGMLLKVRRGTTYMIWDHAIYWRESCLNISSSQCILSLSVQNMLLGVIKMASHVCYTHADVILPCTNLFNPGWEMDIGSDEGQRQHTIGFARKIDPVVNGISEMERFEPVDKIRSENPTVMMLSNVQFIKDVKNAVFSADIIVNRFKFTKYRLVIYGAMDRTPQYTAETEAIIKTRALENNVRLAGFGNPKEILKDAWAFMNSSLSEGLPLAIGEAALSGCPVIATDVGATALVISDPKNPKIRYGEIVPPNDSVALARAQIQILAMLGPWASYCGDDPPPMPETFSPEDVEWITQRMYDKTEERRALGRKGRETVLHSFNGDRYLREHEQMYWIGSHRAQQRADETLISASNQTIKFDETLPIIPIINPRKSKLWDENPWVYFADKDGTIELILASLKSTISQYLHSWRRVRHSTRTRHNRQGSQFSLSAMSLRGLLKSQPLPSQSVADPSSRVATPIIMHEMWPFEGARSIKFNSENEIPK